MRTSLRSEFSQNKIREFAPNTITQSQGFFFCFLSSVWSSEFGQKNQILVISEAVEEDKSTANDMF